MIEGKRSARFNEASGGIHPAQVFERVQRHLCQSYNTMVACECFACGPVEGWGPRERRLLERAHGLLPAWRAWYIRELPEKGCGPARLHVVR